MSRVLVEPLGAGVPGRRPARSVHQLTAGALRIGALAAAFVLVLTSTGDAALIAVALAVAAADRAVFVVVALVGVALLGRWGTTSLAAIAGGQAVIGPAGLTGSWASAASAWAAAAALVALAGGRRWVLVTVTLGLLAALVVAGPAATSPVDAAVRAGAGLAGILAATAMHRLVPRRPAVIAAVVLGAIAAGLGVAP